MTTIDDIMNILNFERLAGNRDGPGCPVYGPPVPPPPKPLAERKPTDLILPGVPRKDARTGEIIYRPYTPQERKEIIDGYMRGDDLKK